MQSPEEFEREQKAVKHWQPPNNHRLLFKSRVFQLERWIASQGFVEEEAVIGYAMKHFNIERTQAKDYIAEVVKDFQRIGIPVIKQ